MNNHPFGFLVRGGLTESRRLVNHAAAFVAYASCDERADVGREAYLSAFAFGEDFRRLLIDTGSCKGFAGSCWSDWLWFDLDAGDDLQRALNDARRLAFDLTDRYQLNDDALLLFFSGKKGFHVGLPTALFRPNAGPDFHRNARRFAERLNIGIDLGVYDRVRAFRAPNSRHPKTGLHKRWLSFDELQGLSLDAVLTLARSPVAFDLPTMPGPCDLATNDWQAALAMVKGEAEGKELRRAAVASGTPTLNRSTLAFIREGAGEGDRHRMLFSAAANLGEFGCPPALVYALLEESALDSGLSPKDVRRQIDCGLSQAGSVGEPRTEGETQSRTEGETQSHAPTTGVCQQPSAPSVSLGSRELAALWARPPQAKQPSTAPHDGDHLNTTGPTRLQETLSRLWEQPKAVAIDTFGTVGSDAISSDQRDRLAALWDSAPPGSAAPTTDEPEQNDGESDAQEHPLDQMSEADELALAFPFGANESGPYLKGDRR